MILKEIPGFGEMIRDNIKSGHYLALLPRHEIYLGVMAGDGPKFAAAFHGTWSRIPLWARRRMLHFWRTGGKYGFAMSPTINLVAYSPYGRKAFGVVDHCGHRLQFWAKRTDMMPSDVLEDLIAHELAHVLQDAAGIRCVKAYSDGRTVNAYPDGTLFGGNQEIEEDADLVMSRWGFNPESIDDWSRATGLNKTKQLDDWGAILRSPERHGR